MKNKSLIALAVFLGIFVFGAFDTGKDSKDKEALILHAVLNFMDALHFEPKTIDNVFSQEVYSNYLEYIDPAHRLITQEEVDQLKVYELEIDDQIRNRTFEFFDLSLGIIENAYDRAEVTFNEVMAQPFDFTATEEIELDYDKRTPASDEAGLKEEWRKFLKYETLRNLRREMADQEKAQEKGEEDLEIKSFSELEKEARESVKETYEDWFGRVGKLRRSDRFETYINAITHIYDPHSDYLNAKEKEDFDIRMGGKLEGIGARLQVDGEFTKVSSIVPGGPAWKGKELEVDDLIYGVTQEDGEYTDVKGMRLDDVVQKIRGPKGTIVTLAVKKQDGSNKDVTIERDEVIIDEGFARSVILTQDNGDRVGYIKLPRFYSSFEGKNGNSCAQDVKKELVKLQEEGVDGVILDLRNNGGGSLRDVIDMSGLFIEKGPIVQVKPRENKARVYKDSDAGVVYSGPLTVMVNNYSASASEILAAALQDYNRAVIVGSNSTFGKGTVQRFFNLDDHYNGKHPLADKLGELKITMQKFYRVDGGSTQLKGVEPDIILPDSYHYFDIGEKDYDNALDWSVIEPLQYDQNVYNITEINSLIENSAERIKDNPEFSLILENALRLKKNKEQSIYSLNYESFDEFLTQREEESKRYKEIMDEDLSSFEISNLLADVDYIESDSSRIARNEDWLTGLQKDIYVEEVLNIMNDMKIKN